MRPFIQRAVRKLGKLDQDQIHSLIRDLAAENDQLEMVLNSLTDGVLVSGSDHSILFLNKSAERFLFLKGRDCLEKKVWEEIIDEDIASFLKNVLDSQERVLDKEFTLDTGSRAQVLSLSLYPLVRNGEVAGNVLHIEDITEKRSREARLRRAENLASLTTLTAGVAHEIKNPLGSIGIHIQLIQKLLKQGGGDGNDQILKYLEIINEEVERLNGIVVDFLFAVRPMDMQYEKKDINTLISNLIDFIHFELESKNIVLSTRYHDNMPEIPVDEKYLKQALLNIIKNAIEAMPDGGEITVGTALDGDALQISVTDEGPGITTENLSKIFEPYYTTKNFGSGLGLTLVYKIIKEHGGDIAIETKEGRGTTFTISLPVPQKEMHLIGWKDNEYKI